MNPTAAGTRRRSGGGASVLMAIAVVAMGAAACGSAPSAASRTPIASARTSTTVTPAALVTTTTSAATTTTVPLITTTTVPPTVLPAGGGQFRSPTSSIHCTLTYADPGVPVGEARCATSVPPEAASVSATGVTTTCTGRSCLPTTTTAGLTLTYGRSVALGPFLCVSATLGMTCTVDGRGFRISRAGIAAIG